MAQISVYYARCREIAPLFGKRCVYALYIILQFPNDLRDNLFFTGVNLLIYHFSRNNIYKQLLDFLLVLIPPYNITIKLKYQDPKQEEKEKIQVTYLRWLPRLCARNKSHNVSGIFCIHVIE